MHAQVGPYFAVASYLAGSDDAWRPLTGLIDGSGGLADRVERTRQALCSLSGSDVEPRVAASTAHLGLVARLLAPPLAAAVLDGRIPRWSPERLWWQPVLGGPMPLAASAVDSIAATPEAWHETVVDGVLRPLTDAVAQEFDVSQQVLWGNVASGIGGATKMVRVARSDAPAETFRDALLAMGPLAGTVDDLGVRHSCCLYYRVPGGGYCADCVLRYSPGRAGPSG